MVIDMMYGIDAIKNFNTRKVSAEIVEGKISVKKEDGSEELVDNVIATIDLNRLPVDELINYMSIFENYDTKNPSSLYNKQKLSRLFDYIVLSVLSANEGVSKDVVKEFVATYFTQLLAPFIKVNGGNVSVSSIPDDIKKNLDIK